MRLTRRDAVAALAAAGVAGTAAALSGDRSEIDGAERMLTDGEMATLVAAAEVLYPSAVEDVDRFVERYVRGRTADRPDHAAGIADAVGYLDEYARAWHDRAFAALDPETRGETLRRMGADGVDPDPNGEDVERVRYYVVNELLFALYTTPTGGALVGIENPQGHPGGTESYQRGPQS